MSKSRHGDILVEFSRRFGMIAVSRGDVTPKQLKEALAEQVDDDLAYRPHQLLGNIFFEKNQMTLTQIEQVLDELVMEMIKQNSVVSKKRKYDCFISSQALGRTDWQKEKRRCH